MRKILLYTLTTLAAAGMASCEDFLTRDTYDQIGSDEFWKSETDLELYANGFIQKMIPGDGTITRGDIYADYCAVDIPTDLLRPDGNVSPDNQTGWAESNWTNLRRVNYMLDNMHKCRGRVSDEIYNHYEGVARFWRAWFYYDKVQTFGAVPWYDFTIAASDKEAMMKPRDSREYVMDKVLEDLTFASTYCLSDAKFTKGSALINKWVALAFKSRVCLFEAAYRRYHNLTGLEITPEELYREAAKAAKLVIDNSGCSLNTAAGKKGAYRDLFYSETPLTQEVILAVCANEKSGIFGEQNWWFNARSYGLCWSLVRSFVHTYLKQDGTPFTAAADYAVKSFAEEMEGRDLRLEQTVRGRNFLWDGKTAVADIKNLSLTGYQVIKYTLDESKYDGGAKNINSIPLIRYAEVLLNYAEAQAELGVLTDSEWALTVGALRKRAGITGGTETLPTTVDSYLQRTFYPDVTSPVLLEIRRERAIELVAEGMRFDDLRRWKCGSLMETLPWSGIHIPGLEQPVDVNGDGVNDYYFTEGEVVSAPAAYKNIAVRVNQDGVGLYAEANPVSGYDLVYKTGAGDRYWYPDGRQYLYPIPAKVIRDYRNAGYTISQNPEWDNE